jgi:hypothetical protein
MFDTDFFRRLRGRWTKSEEFTFFVTELIRSKGLELTMGDVEGNPRLGREGARRLFLALQGARIRCSRCGKALEYLGSPAADLKADAQVLGSAGSLNAMEQWRGNVCVPCRQVFCPECIAVGRPTPCPSCSQPTQPAMKTYLEGAKSLRCSKCGASLSYLGHFGAAFNETRGVEGTGQTDAAWEEWQGRVCAECRKVFCQACLGWYKCPDCDRHSELATRFHLHKAGLSV